MTSSLSYQRDCAAQMDSYQRRHERKLVVPELYIASLDGVRTPEQDLIERQEWQRLDYLIDCLTPPRLGLAFRYRYGFRCKPMTYSQIAGKFGLTTARVQQIVGKAERVLRYKFLREKNPKLLRDILAREEAEERAKKQAEYAALDRAMEARRTRDDIRREAQRAAEHEWYRQQREQSAFDAAYEEASRLNRYWKEEVERRERVVRQRENERKRVEAFSLQAQNLKDAYEAYYASLGTPAEHYCYIIYLNRMKEWGPVQDQIWKDFPYD